MHVTLAFIAFFVSLYTAVQIASGEIHGGVLLQMIVLTVLFFTTSWIVYRKFPERFVSWKEITHHKLLMYIYFPPVSTFFMAIGLSFFLLTFLNEDLRKTWEFIKILPSVLGMSLIFPAGAIFFVILFMPWSKYLQLEHSALQKKIMFVALWTLFWVIVLFLIWVSFAEFRLLYEQMMVPIFVFLAGSIPLGWLYELYFGSFAKRALRKAV